MGAGLALNGLIFVLMLVIKKLVLVFLFSCTFDCGQFSTAFPLHFAYLLLGTGGCFVAFRVVCVCVCGGGGGVWRPGMGYGLFIVLRYCDQFFYLFPFYIPP